MSAPRVLHISLSDYRGGADIAARQIFRAVRLAGVDARMAVRASKEPNQGVSEIPLGSIRKSLADASIAVASRVQKSSNPFHRSLNVVPTGGIEIPGFTPDLVHLHWIGSNTLSLKEVQEIPVPVVWTLHDSWPFAGAEHHPSYPDDLRFVEGYSRGNRLHSSRVDVDALVWKRKHHLWHRRFHLAAPSRWMAEQASNSVLMGDQPVVVIPNPVDSFAPQPLGKDRARLGVDPQAFVIVTAAIGGTGIANKGWGTLRDAVAKVAERESRMHLLMIGQDDPPSDVPAGVQCTTTGRLRDSAAVQEAMTSGDVFVTTSTIESFGLAAAEASAAGLPVIATSTTGLLDVVVDGETGWAFPVGDVNALAAAIVDAANDPAKRREFGEAGRLRAQELWSPAVVGRSYRNMYESVLSERLDAR